MKFIDLLVGAIIIGLLYLASYQLDQKTSSIFRNSENTNNECKEDSFDVRDFVLELHIQKLQYPDVVLRQAALESGWFTSPTWRNKHNPFGFTYKGEYLMFNDWKSSIIYMRDWQNKYYKGGDYYSFLTKIGYALDSNYITTLKGINLSNLKNK